MIVQHELNHFINTNREKIQQELTHHLHQLDIPEQLKNSMIYSAEAGGKRLRPILLIASFNAYSDDVSKVLSSAVALELIHTYSLIHDDLPAMDDDDVRRGHPTNHIKFDEATAILAGDALLTFSFELIANDVYLTDNQKVQLIQLFSKASGPKGMVAGQILDMEAEKKAVTLEELETIHALKTGELFRFAIRSGAYLGEATREQIAHLDKFAHFLGLIFQIQDDILDVTGDAEKICKTIGNDETNEKNTYVKLLDIDGAVEKKEYYVSKAKKELSEANADASYLMALVDYLSNRDH